MKHQRIFLFIVLLMMQGCANSHSVDVAQISDIEIYARDTGTRIVQKGSRDQRKLLAWISDNRRGWETYRITLPAPEITISTSAASRNVALLVTGNTVYLRQDEKAVLVRKLDDDEVRFFHELAFANVR